MRGLWPIIALLLFAGSALGQERSALPCRYDDKKCAREALRGHPVAKPEFWQHAFAKPLEQRIGPAPPELIEFLALDNISQGISNKPRAAVLTPDFLKDVQDAFAEIPAEVKRLLPARLAGIYFVEDFGGTGFTDQIGDDVSKPAPCFIVLDPSVLQRHTANSWATWKENTPFGSEPGFGLTATIEDAPHDNRKNAIQYILLHELGHVLSVNNRFHPSWKLEAKDVRSTAEFPFFGLSWTISADRKSYVSRFDAAFLKRKDVVYYFGAKLAASDMAGVYGALENTNFATLYSATTPVDDFAEAFASYVHSVLLKRPFEIRISTDGKIEKVYASCWTQPRCAQKRRILEKFLDANRKS